MKEWKIDNALVGMKDQLIRQMDMAESAEELSTVLSILQSVEELWTAIGYAYKGKELCRRLSRHANSVMIDLAPQAKRKRAELVGIRQIAMDLAINYDNNQSQYWDDQMADSYERYRNETLVQI